MKIYGANHYTTVHVIVSDKDNDDSKARMMIWNLLREQAKGYWFELTNYKENHLGTGFPDFNPTADMFTRDKTTLTFCFREHEDAQLLINTMQIMKETPTE